MTGHVLRRLPCYLAGDNVLLAVFDWKPEKPDTLEGYESNKARSIDDGRL